MPRTLETENLYEHTTSLKLISKLLLTSLGQKFHPSSWNIQQMHAITHPSLSQQRLS